MDCTDLIWELWLSYKKNTPTAQKVEQLLEVQKGDYFNDHIAFRTLNLSGINKDVLAAHFQSYGWAVQGSYFFKEKKLNAIHLEHTENKRLPKIFISELILEQTSTEVQEILQSAFGLYRNMSSDQVVNCGRKHKINYKDYRTLLNETEYGSWLYTFGFIPNHFTVYVNNYDNLSIENLINMLSDQGLSLNTAGGLIKGGESVGLKQASTMADSVNVFFEDLDKSLVVASCYVEFAQRFFVAGKLFEGFITSSADKIFESTDTK